ncbi:MAG TPA: hypothetical protein VMU89_21420 [Thermomicrobiaceae bacterium]|nr:hypothetical protein [Thermomicrobiaceae bacterium]
MRDFAATQFGQASQPFPAMMSPGKTSQLVPQSLHVSTHDRSASVEEDTRGSSLSSNGLG